MLNSRRNQILQHEGRIFICLLIREEKSFLWPLNWDYLTKDRNTRKILRSFIACIPHTHTRNNPEKWVSPQVDLRGVLDFGLTAVLKLRKNVGKASVTHSTTKQGPLSWAFSPGVPCSAVPSSCREGCILAGRGWLSPSPWQLLFFFLFRSLAICASSKWTHAGCTFFVAYSA